ncbi:hypothetical protein JCM8097_001842 [Rhodosporidiobolus ruineniae]
MVRFTHAALFTAAGSALVLAAAPPPLTGQPAEKQCASYTTGEGPAALCAPLNKILSQLTFQGDSVTTTVYDVSENVKKITDALDKATNGLTTPLSDIISSAVGGDDTGVVANLVDTVDGVLGSVTSLGDNLLPQCVCDLSKCYGSLTAATKSTQTAASAADCAAFYSNDDIVAAVPGCADTLPPTPPAPVLRRRRRVSFA